MHFNSPDHTTIVDILKGKERRAIVFFTSLSRKAGFHDNSFDDYVGELS